MERKINEIVVYNLSNKTMINTVSSLEVVQETNLHKVKFETSSEHLKYKRVKRQLDGASQNVTSRTFSTLFENKNLNLNITI